MTRTTIHFYRWTRFLIPHWPGRLVPEMLVGALHQFRPMFLRECKSQAEDNPKRAG